MSSKYFKVYRSSAGSGKTFTLAKEYIYLILQKPSSYRNILAVTFTNKATREMKERIITFLDHLSGANEDDPFFQVVQREIDLPADTIKERARLGMINILHNYGYFSVSTIDSFFQKVIRSFAKELNLNGSFTLELDHEKVLYDLIDRIMLDLDTNNQLAEWLVRFSEKNIQEGKSWDVRTNIFNLAQEIFKEHYKLFEKDLHDKQNVLESLLKDLYKIKNDFEEFLINKSNAAIILIESHQLSVADFAHGQNGFAGYFEKIIKNRKFEPGVRVKGAVNNLDKWTSKTSGKKEKVAKIFHAGLNDILSECINFYDQQIYTYNTANELLRYLYVVGVLTNISRKLQQYRQDNDVMLISDAAVFLKSIISNNDAPFIYEKTGSLYKHFLIDEFQDTSGYQWENFRPLVKNSLAEGNLNLVVGDVKQSIYRWRGGDWELLLKKLFDDINKDFIDEYNLGINYRSASNIVSFNNILFSLASNSLYNQIVIPSYSITEAETIELEKRKILEAYKDVWQDLPGSKLSGEEGYVQVKFLSRTDESDEAVDWRRKVIEGIPGLLEKLQDQNYLLKDIMILVRRKEEGKDIIDEILSYRSSPKAKDNYNYDILSSESLFLENSNSVKIIITVLRYLVNPDDKINLVNLVYDYQKMILNNDSINLNYLFSFNDQEKILENYLPNNLNYRYSSVSFYELIEQIINDFSLHDVTSETAYIHSFLDQVLDFTYREGGNISLFLQWWEQTGRFLSIQMPEEVNAVRLFTIHKAKGLQAKIVIMPFCYWGLDHTSSFDNVIWCKDRSGIFNHLQFYPVKYTQALQDTWFQLDYYLENMKATIDNLNLLYVAFTRAENELYVFCPEPSFDKKGNFKIKYVSDLLYNIITEDHPDEKGILKQYWNDEEKMLSIGNPVLLKEKKTEMAENELIKPTDSANWRDKIFIRTRSVGISDRKEGISKQRFGQIIHEIISKINSVNEMERVISNFYYEGRITKNDQDSIKETISKILKIEKVRQWFSTDWDVKSEVPIISVQGEIFRPDRILIKSDQVVIIDFKTGNPAAKDHQQLKNYISLIREMGYSKAEGYLVYLQNETIEQIKE